MVLHCNRLQCLRWRIPFFQFCVLRCEDFSSLFWAWNKRRRIFSCSMSVMFVIGADIIACCLLFIWGAVLNESPTSFVQKTLPQMLCEPALCNVFYLCALRFLSRDRNRCLSRFSSSLTPLLNRLAAEKTTMCMKDRITLQSKRSPMLALWMTTRRTFFWLSEWLHCCLAGRVVLLAKNDLHLRQCKSLAALTIVMWGSSRLFTSQQRRDIFHVRCFHT